MRRQLTRLWLNFGQWVLSTMFLKIEFRYVSDGSFGALLRHEYRIFGEARGKHCRANGPWRLIVTDISDIEPRG